MTQTQITSFMTVAKEGSFTRAANAMYISQPAISKNVSTLEEELGVRLFDRRGGMLAITEAGQLLLDFFRSVSAQFGDVLLKAKMVSSPSHRTIRIGCPDTWNPRHFYADIKNYFFNHHPELELSIECYKLSELIGRLKGGMLDIVLTHDFYTPSLYGLASMELTKTGCGVVYSKSEYGLISDLNELSHLPFLLYDGDIQRKIGGIIKELCHRDVSILDCGAMASALFSMSCGKGVMLFTSWDSAVDNAEFGFLPFDQTLPVKMLYLPEGGNDSVKLFIKEAVNVFV